MDGEQWQRCAMREMETSGGIPLHVGVLSHGLRPTRREKAWPLCVQAEVGKVKEAQMVLQARRWDERKAVQKAGWGMRSWKASEALGLPWQGSYWWLGACETGRGRSVRGEGEESMARSLLMAGSRGVQMTLWKVDEGATQRWLTKVGQQLRKGDSAAMALKKAQQHLRQGERFAHPYYWSGFVLLAP